MDTEGYYEKLYKDEVAAGKIVRGQRDEALRQLKILEETRLETDRIHAEAGAPYGTPADTRELVKRVLASVNEYTSAPKTFWVLKRKSDGLYMGEVTSYAHGDVHYAHTSTPEGALQWRSKPAAYDGYTLVRICVHEEEED